MKDTDYSDLKNHLQSAKLILCNNTVEHDAFETIAEDIEILIKKIKQEVYF